MNCDQCGQDKATINVVDIVSGKKTQLQLCEKCYAQNDLKSPFSQQDVAEVFSQAPTIETPGGTGTSTPTEGPSSQIMCEECGYSLAEFEKNGRVSCSHDYETFQPFIQPLLKSLHGAATHTGKIPARIKDSMVRSHRVNQLEEELATAVDEEDYEAAVALRDRIRDLRSGKEAEVDE